jgi:DNA replicative helicase MCM subunit Mcm2 (Cdc46/Mcm family)
MVNKDSWDADERNKKNDLHKYLEALTRHQQQMIKGIESKHAWKYLNLEEQIFRHQLEDSLTLVELSKLLEEEKRFRDKLIEEVMAVWRRNQTIIKEGKKDLERKLEYEEEKAAEKWTPRHHEPTPIDRDKIYSVSEASRLHKAKNVSVTGVISGIQPLRKMIKGLSVQCRNCNQVWEIKYDIPGFSESRVAIERINKCPACKTGDYLGPFDYENINAVVIELKDCDSFSEIDSLRIIVFGDDEPAFDNTRNIEKHIGETIVVTGDIYSIDIGKGYRDIAKVMIYKVQSLYHILQLIP